MRGTRTRRASCRAAFAQLAAIKREEVLLIEQQEELERDKAVLLKQLKLIRDEVGAPQRRPRKPATRNRQRATRNAQYATCKCQQSTYNVQQSACNRQHATRNIQQSTCNTSSARPPLPATMHHCATLG